LVKRTFEFEFKGDLEESLVFERFFFRKAEMEFDSVGRN